MNLKGSASLALLSLATVFAHAASLVFDQPSITVVRPATGSTAFTFFGTATATDGSLLRTIAPIAPSLANSTVSLSIGGPPTFPTNPLAGLSTYTGGLLFGSVNSNTPLGAYAYIPLGTSPVYATLTDTGNNQAQAFFIVTVVAAPVPEPSPLLALGLAPVALLRRRRR